MSIDLLLRALRKCEQLPDSDDDRFSILIEDEWRVNQFLYEDRIRHLSILADKIHKKIVERFNHIPLCAICEGLLVGEAIKALELPTEALK